MARSDRKLDQEIEAFLNEAMSDDSAESEKILHKAESKPWWLDDDESDNEIGKGHIFLKSNTSGPTHSTPNDSKKKSNENERSNFATALKENSTKVERVSNRYARIGELSNNQKGIKRYEGTISKDSLEDISEKSEEDSESKRNKMQKKTVVINETTSQVAAPVIITAKPPEDKMVHTESPLLLQENSHPGQDTLEEMMDKQKFFSELEQDASGTLDYGLLNQQLSKTTSMDLNVGGNNENSPILNSAYGKDPSETPPTQQKPSLLSKVSLMDSMGSSLNTTGTSIQVDTGNSPVVSKEYNKDVLKDTEFVPTQKEYSGTVTSQEMEDLHVALQNIDMSSTIPPADRSPPDHQFPSNIHRTLESVEAATQLTDESHIQSPSETVPANDGSDVIDSGINKLTINDMFKNSEPEPSARLSNQDPDSSLEQPTPVVYGFDLMPAVVAQSPDHDLSTSVAASMEIVKTKVKCQEKDPIPPTQPKKSTSNMKLQKTNQFSKLPSSGYGQRSLTTSKLKANSQVSSSCSAPVHKPGLASCKTLPSKNKPTTNNCRVTSASDLPPDNDIQDSEISQVCPQEKGDNCKTDKINTEHIKDLQTEVEYWRNKWEEEKQQLLQLKGIIAEMETNHEHSLNQQKQIYENEIDRLKKSNFVLNSKISKVEENVSDPARLSSEELAELQKELSEQQVLLSGYQTENERLYNEMKQLKATYKVTEDRMFRENQKLLMELSNLKNQHKFKENLYLSQVSQQIASTHNAMENAHKSSSSPTSSESGYCTNCGGQPAIFAVSKISQLESQRQHAQDECELAKSQNSILEKTKKELETQINLLIHQKEEMRQSLQEVKNAKLEEFQVIECKLNDERDQMKKQLQWYAYNQQLLDQDIAVFKQKDKEIDKLNKRIDQLQSEAGRRLEENKLRLKEKSTFQSRIQDLERQVREMERIFQKRNPNSLTTLFLAARNLEQDEDTTSKESPPVIKVLEEKVKKLESEMEMKENLEEKRIRSVEQKYNKLKFQYEEQIEKLEQQVRQFQQKSSLGDHPYSHRLALEKELESVRERHRNETAELQVQLEQLQTTVDKLKKDDGHMRTEMEATRERESEIQAQNQVLRKQLENSNQQATMLRTSVSRLQREKKQQQQQLIRQQVSARQNSNTSDFNKRQKAKKNDSSAAQKKFQENKNFPEIPEEILEENESLKTELDQLHLTIEQQKVELYKTKAESEASFWQMQEKHQVQIDALRLSHQRELQRILTEQTLQNSTSQVPELLSKVDAQQILINHLKEQLASAQVDSEKLSALKIREVVLENQVQQLEDELKEAKASYSPDRRHFENLVSKIQELENKHSVREKELQNIIKNGMKLQAPELEKEVNKWKQIAESKNQDIENYRVELDSILNILQSLQKQGLIISGNGLKPLRVQNVNMSNH